MLTLSFTISSVVGPIGPLCLTWGDFSKLIDYSGEYWIYGTGDLASGIWIFIVSGDGTFGYIATLPVGFLGTTSGFFFRTLMSRS